MFSRRAAVSPHNIVYHIHLCSLSHPRSLFIMTVEYPFAGLCVHVAVTSTVDDWFFSFFSFYKLFYNLKKIVPVSVYKENVRQKHRTGVALSAAYS